MTDYDVRCRGSERKIASSRLIPAPDVEYFLRTTHRETVCAFCMNVVGVIRTDIIAPRSGRVIGYTWIVVAHTERHTALAAPPTASAPPSYHTEPPF